MITPQHFSDEEKNLAECLETKYGINATSLLPMNGITDLTYKINDDYVVRVYVSARTNIPELINAETELLTFMKSRNFPVADVMKTRDGETIAFVQRKEGDSVVATPIRVQSFIRNSLWSDKQVVDAKISGVVGEFVGRLNLAFQEFHHDYYRAKPELFFAIRYSEESDVRRMTYIVEHDSKWLRIVNRINEVFNEKVVAHMDELPKQQLHCDINWRNLMVNDELSKITGVIDFADSKYTVRIYELAIALPTAFLNDAKPETFAYAEAMIKGYTKHIKLTELERQALLPCVLARLGILALGTELLVNQGFSRLPAYTRSLFGDVWKTMEVLMDDYENGHRFQAIVDSTK